MVEEAGFGVCLALLPELADLREIVRTPGLEELTRLRLLPTEWSGRLSVSAVDGSGGPDTAGVETDYVIAS